jgi:hypothetical protein
MGPRARRHSGRLSGYFALSGFAKRASVVAGGSRWGSKGTRCVCSWCSQSRGRPRNCKRIAFDLNLPLRWSAAPGKAVEGGDPRARRSATGNGSRASARAGCPGVNVESSVVWLAAEWRTQDAKRPRIFSPQSCVANLIACRIRPRQAPTRPRSSAGGALPSPEARAAPRATAPSRRCAALPASRSAGLLSAFSPATAARSISAKVSRYSPCA